MDVRIHYRSTAANCVLFCAGSLCIAGWLLAAAPQSPAIRAVGEASKPSPHFFPGKRAFANSDEPFATPALPDQPAEAVPSLDQEKPTIESKTNPRFLAVDAPLVPSRVTTSFEPKPSPHFFPDEVRFAKRQMSLAAAASSNQPIDRPPSPTTNRPAREAGESPFHLASLPPQVAPKTPLKPTAVLPVAHPEFAAGNTSLASLPSRQSAPAATLQPTEVLPAPRPSFTAKDTSLASLSPRLSSPMAPLQPAEVFSVPHPDFFAEEIRLTGLDSRLPPPESSLVPAEVLPVNPSSASIQSQFRLAALQQRLPAPDASLQPAEVLPIPTPYSPAAPRVPALDQDRPIGALTTNVTPTAGRLPQDVAVERFRGDYPPWEPRGWNETVYFWDAPALCYNGLRYEEVNLERFGYTCCCPCLQPAVSAAHFFAATLALPYNLTVHPPGECIYPLGHYRPGSPVPFRKIWPEFRPLAAAAEVGTIAGLILLIP